MPEKEELNWEMLFTRDHQDAIYSHTAGKGLTPGKSGISCFRCGDITVFQPCANCGGE